MQWLAEVCVRRPVFATVLILILTVTGMFGYAALGVDRFPKIDFPFVVITTVQPGGAPEQIESEVTDRVEEAVNTISGIDELRSTSAESVSQVFVQFSLEKNLDVAVAEVRDKLSLIQRDLPTGTEPPVVARLDPDAQPVITLSVDADIPLREITEYTDRVIRRRLENVNGVGQVSVVGGRKRQINITLDASRLRSFGLTALDVSRTLQAQNLEFPGGVVDQGARQLTLRTQGKVREVEELGELIIGSRGTNQLRIKDVAEVTDGEEEAETVALLNGRNAVVLIIKKQSGTNTVEVVDAVKARVEEVQKQIPPGYRIKVINDQSQFVRAAIHAVEEHLILGSLLAALVVLMFLGSARSTIISAVAIPASIISTFALMKAMGFTLNVLTLLALTLSVGIVIDDAIVVLENIVRFIDEKGMKPMQAAVEATREIGMAVLATTLSLAIIFVPVSFMGGIIGRFLNSFGLTMAFAIMVSMLVSFSLTPMMSARMLKPSKPQGPGGADEPTSPAAPHSGAHAPGGAHSSGFLFGPIERGYTALLAFLLNHRWIVGILILATLGSLGPLMGVVKKNFLPNDDESQFGVFVRMPEGTTLRQTAIISQKISREISRHPETSDVLVTIGDDAGATANSASFRVSMVDVSQRKMDQEDFMDVVRNEVMPKFKDLNLRTSVARFGIVGGGGNMNAMIQYRLSGADLVKLDEYARQLMAQMATIPKVVDIDTSSVVGKPELRLVVDRAKAADLGVSMIDVAQAAQAMVGGLDSGRFEQDGQQYDIHVRAGLEYRNSLDGLLQLTVPSRKLGQVRLADLATLSEGTGPSVINRFNRGRQVTIFANMAPGGSLGSIMEELGKKVAEMKLDPGYSGDFVGQSKEQAKMGKAFMTAFLLSFLFMYLVLAAQFESWVHPITILLALPLTVPFAIMSIVLLNESINIFSMLGVLVLFGVVKKNGILQIDHANQLRATGLSAKDAVLFASRDRLRPILMTTVAFVAGMIPTALSTGTGAATNRATSSVIVGGQILSLVLTLVATPVAYTWFDDLQNGTRLKRMTQWLKGLVGRKPAV
jgi:HAE1 family hydrophobic/amphiphilic exporter-1